VGGPVTVTVEATLPWAWLHDRLTAAGFPVQVAHPQQVKLISHARCKTDPIDARKLAELTRFHSERLRRAKGKPKATVAAARKLGTYIYWMWRQELSYAVWLETETKRVGCPMHTLASSA